MPFWLIKKLARKKRTKLLCIYDEQEFIGILYLAFYQDIIFVFYFAIREDIRGKSYGSRVIDLLKKEYDDKRILLNIELVDKHSSNYQERVRRKNFYQKNGFQLLNYKVKEVSEVYEMLCYHRNGKMVEKKEYEELLRYCYGNFIFKIFQMISR